MIPTTTKARRIRAGFLFHSIVSRNLHPSKKTDYLKILSLYMVYDKKPLGIPEASPFLQPLKRRRNGRLPIITKKKRLKPIRRIILPQKVDPFVRYRKPIMIANKLTINMVIPYFMMLLLCFGMKPSNHPKNRSFSELRLPSSST